MIWAGPKKITDLIIRKNYLFSAIMAIASKARYGTDDLRPYYNSVRSGAMDSFTYIQSTITF